jgi:hypothetical protein
MTGRWTFWILTYSQLSGIKVKAVIRPKYDKLTKVEQLIKVQQLNQSTTI